MMRVLWKDGQGKIPRRNAAFDSRQMIELPDFSPLRATATKAAPTRAAFDGLDHVLVIAPHAANAALARLPYGKQLAALHAREGQTAELKNLIDYSRRFKIGLIAITADGQSTLGKAADVALVLPQAREACPHNLAPTTSSLMQLALGDALAIALLESRGFTAIDFGLLHPGGRLGAMLKFVRDVMHRDASMPLVATGTRMSRRIQVSSTSGGRRPSRAPSNCWWRSSRMTGPSSGLEVTHTLIHGGG